MYSTSVKDLFLNEQLFIGLNNINTGFDVLSIKYFDEQDFKEILRRVEAKGLGIYGIEPWADGAYFDCITYESTLFMCTSPRWYWKAFYQLCTKAAQQNCSLQWSASYYVPDAILEAYKNKLN